MRIEFNNGLSPEIFAELEDYFTSVEFRQSQSYFKEVVVNSDDYIRLHFENWLEEQMITNWYTLSYDKNKNRFYLT